MIRLRLASPLGGPRAGALYAASALVLLLWTAYLERTLATHSLVTDWSAVWVGFDLLLAGALGSTALALRRGVRSAERLAALCAGLLLGDAWFDLTTAHGAAGVALAGVLALTIELPLAALCLTTTTLPAAVVRRGPEHRHGC